jgi:hypothetical protein
VTAHVPMSRQEIILDFLYSVDPAELERRVRRAPPEAGPEAAGPEAAGPEAAGPEAAGPEAAVVIRALADLATEAAKREPPGTTTPTPPHGSSSAEPSSGTPG